jgi:hypothetical protein
VKAGESGAVAGRNAVELLERVGVLRNRTDLDLLVFFAEHPSSLLAMDSLAGFVGCGHTQIAASLEVLLAAGLLQRRQTPAHAARLYVFEPDAAARAWLPALLTLSGTREGRLALREALVARAGESAPAGREAGG